MEHIFLLILFINGCKCSKLTDEAAFVANTLLESRYITAVVWWRSETEDITEFLKSYSGSVYIADVNSNKTEAWILSTQYIFFVTESDELTHFANLISEKVKDVISVVVVLTKPVTDEELYDITKIAYENDMGDIVILSASSNDSVIKAYTYFPFGVGSCSNNTPVIIRDKFDKFPLNKYSNYYGCPIRVTTLDILPFSIAESNNDDYITIGAIDGKYLTLVTEKLNATMKFVPITDGQSLGVCENGTCNGAFGNVYHKRADVMLPPAIFTPLRYNCLQVTPAYHSYNLVWIAPGRREIYGYLKIFLPFLSPLTLLLIVITVVFGAVTMLVRWRKTIRIDLFVTYQMLLDQPAKFTTTNSLMNCLFGMWMWYCLLMRIFYMGGLVNEFQKTILEPPFATFEEALKTVRGYGGAVAVGDLFNGTAIKDKFASLSLPNVLNSIKKMSEGDRYLVGVESSMARPYERYIQIIPKSICHLPAGIYMRPRWKGSLDMNNIILKGYEMGFLEKITGDYYHLMTLKSNISVITEKKPLDMYTMSPCFLILFINWALCFFVFLLEIISHKLFNRN